MTDTVNVDVAREFLPRVESILRTQADAAEDLKEVLAEAKEKGLDTKALRAAAALSLRGSDAIDKKRAEHEQLDAYLDLV